MLMDSNHRPKVQRREEKGKRGMREEGKEEEVEDRDS